MKRNLMLLFAVLGILLFGSLALSGADRNVLIADDPDRDGVPSPVDLCPQVNASSFDRNGDGCIDDPAGARHTEFWMSADLPFVYYINAKGAPSINDGSDFTAMQNALNAWTAIAGVDFTVSYGGTTQQTSAAALDLVNLITFEDYQYQFSNAVIAVGISTSFTVDSLYQGTRYLPGQIVDADLIFNPVKGFKTHSAGPANGIDIRSVSTHEAGHLFGISHSPVATSTMFFVLPAGTDAASLSKEDELVFFKAYATPAALAAANRISGTVTSGSEDGLPVPGAIVYAIDEAGDTVAADYTLPDGSYTFVGMDDGSYYVAIHPLDGTAAIGYLKKGYINALVDSTANIVFPPEYYDQAESAQDNALDKTAVAVSGGSTVSDIDIVTNIDASHPTVVSMTPSESAEDVQIDAALMIAFSEAIDDASIQGNFALRDADNHFISGKATFLKDDSVIAFTPTIPFDFGKSYNLTLGMGLADKYGNGLELPYMSTFTTELLPPLAIMNLSPAKGVVGNLIVINGVGFSATPSENTVLFGSEQAQIVDAFPNRLVVRVPQSATTDLVTVTVGELISDGVTFTVLSATEVARGFQSGVAELDAMPRSLTVLPDGGWAYVATDAGAAAVVIDPGLESYLTVTTISVPGGLEAVEATPDGKRVYAVSRVNRKLCTIDTDLSHGPLFNTIVAEHELSADPLGICVDPGGGRAYIATLAGEVQIWDVKSGSATYENQIGAVASPDGTVRGKMAVDPAGRRLLTLSGAGKMNVFDLGPDTLLAQVPVLIDPQDVVIDPAGQRAYVSDGTGSVTVVSLEPLFKVQDIVTGGSNRGMTITPGGFYLYACNQQLDYIDVIDLDENSATFRSVAATIDLGASPIDIDLSPDGFYAFSVTRDTRQIVVTTIGLGPTLASISRRAAPFGARLVLAGSGFGTDPAKIRVQFAGPTGEAEWIQPTYSTGTAIEVGVPTYAQSGPVRIIVNDDVFPAGNRQVSNSLYFEMLKASSGSGALRLASGVPTEWELEFTDALAFSPTGDFLMVGGLYGAAAILDTDPESADYNQFIGSVAGGNDAINTIAITPDGQRAFIDVDNDIAVRCFNVNRHSNLFGYEIGRIAYTPGPTEPASINTIAISPDGERLFLSIHHPTSWDTLFVVDIVPGSAYENRPVAFLEGFAPGKIAFHPSGRYAYMTGLGDSILVLNTNPLDARYLEIVGRISMPDTMSTVRYPQALTFTPDGRECLVATVRVDGPTIESVVTLDTSDPVNPAVAGILTTNCGGNLRGVPKIDVSPRGDRAILALPKCAYYTINLNTTPHEITNARFDMSIVGATDMDFTADGSRFYVVAQYALSDSIWVYDFSGANYLLMRGGNEQSGVVGQPLSAPLRVFVAPTDTATVGIQGVPLTFRVTRGGGHFTESGLTTQTVATDQNGYAELEWTLGDTVGVQTQLVSVEAIGLAGSPLQFVADSYDDPAYLPLQLVQVLPFGGASNVSVTTAVQGTFSRAVARTNITDSTFYVFDPVAAAKIPVTVGFADGDKKVTLVPMTALDYDRSYEMVWTSGILDLDAGALENPGGRSFITGSKPPLMLSSVAPASGTIGAKLVLSGQGFDAVAANNAVLFRDRAVTPYEATVTSLKVTVPADAISGEVRVACGADTSNAMFFTVLVPSTSPVDEVIATVETGSSTKSVAVTPDGALAYSVSPDGDVVVPIDVEGQTSYSSISVGDNPVAIAIDPAGTYAYICNFGSGTVSVIVVDPDSTTFNTVVQTITVGTNPIDVDVNPDGSRVYVANAGSSDVSVIDGDDASATWHQVVATVETGSSAKSVVVTPDGARIYVGTDGGYVVIDALSNAAVATVETGSSTKSVAITPDGALLIVLSTSGTIYIYDVQPGSASENEVVATVETGTTVKSVVVTPDGAMLYIIFEDSDEAVAYALTVTGSVGAIEPGMQIPPPVVELTPVHTVPTGKDPACIAFDPSGSGWAIICNAGDNTVTILNATGLPPGPLAADILVTPRTLKLSSGGRWVEGRIELPAAYAPEEIDIATVLLQDTIPVAPGADARIEDRDGDGLRELVVKFDRAPFQAILPQGEYVPVAISGTARNRAFIGADTIRTIRPVVQHPCAEIVTMGAPAAVVWTSPSGYRVDSVSIDGTFDDGADWFLIARRIPDAHSFTWRVPAVMADRCRVMITLWAGGEILGQGMSQDVFMISAPLAVTLASFAGAFENEAAVLRWSTLIEENIEGFNVLRSEREADGYEPVNADPVASSGAAGGASYEMKDPDVSLSRIYYYKLEAISGGRTRDLSGPCTVVCRAPFSLEQNAPNPFNPSTSIKFTIAEDARVTLVVYDVGGRRVKTLVDRDLKASFYRVAWDGRNENGRNVASGIYFYRLQAGSYVQSRKMILLR